ncbi:hypothetical protein [Shewanella sp. AC91-MNA-CIBAN-0169]|uniref:hypothetical protein n=1 Tax=Shewanella sp. AC91-MNA-CIBAN-0169 TaxID=3140466 RepID=UPI003334736A
MGTLTQYQHQPAQTLFGTFFEVKIVANFRWQNGCSQRDNRPKQPFPLANELNASFTTANNAIYHNHELYAYD